jgi:hypothetical protein
MKNETWLDAVVGVFLYLILFISSASLVGWWIGIAIFSAKALLK